MSLTRLTCPSCSVVLTVDKPVPAGKTIRCPKCKTTFPAPGPQAAPKEAPRGTSAPRTAPSRPPAKAAPERRPAPRPRDDDAERPRPEKAAAKAKAPKPGRADDEDWDDDDWEEEDRPRRSRRAKKRGSGLPIAAAIVGSVAILVVIGCVVAATVWFMSPKNKQQDYVEQKAAPIFTNQVMPDMRALSQARSAGFEGWLQDLEAAKRKASSENKDLLIYFGGSDWSRLSK